MPTEQEIYNALLTLKKVCEENQTYCEKCMLRNESNTCGILSDNNDNYREALLDIALKDYKKPRLIIG